MYNRTETRFRTVIILVTTGETLKNIMVIDNRLIPELLMTRSFNKASRLRQLEEQLLTGAKNGGFTTPELARRLGVSRQTIWRDIEELTADENVPIIESDDQRYWIDPMDYVSNIRLTVGESLMLYTAMRRAVRRTSYAPPSMVNAMDKLTLTLRHPLADQLAATTKTFEQRVADADLVQVWENLTRAWIEEQTVRLLYQSHKRPEPRSYDFQPYLFEPVVLSEGVYVIGYSLTHESLRTFKVERILRATLVGPSFERRDIDVDTLLKHAWGVWYGSELYQVQLHFSQEVAARVKETVWHPSQIIRDLPNGKVEWCVEIAGLLELVPWIRGWGPDVEVIAPTELRARIAEETRRAAALYSGE